MLRQAQTARIIMILCIAAAVVFGSGRSLRKVQKQTEDIFFDEIAEDIYANWENAVNMLTVAGHIWDETDEMNELDAQLDVLAEAEEPVSILKQNELLAEKALALCDAAEVEGAAESDIKELKKLYGNIRENNNRASASDYHDAVQAANQKLRTFPASVLRHLTGVKVIEEV